MIKINKYMQSYFYLDGSKHRYWQKPYLPLPPSNYKVIANRKVITILIPGVSMCSSSTVNGLSIHLPGYGKSLVRAINYFQFFRLRGNISKFCDKHNVGARKEFFLVFTLIFEADNLS